MSTRVCVCKCVSVGAGGMKCPPSISCPLVLQCGSTSGKVEHVMLPSSFLKSILTPASHRKQQQKHKVVEKQNLLTSAKQIGTYTTF